MKDLHDKSIEELNEEKWRRYEEIQHLNTKGFCRRQVELLERLTGNIAKIEAEINKREREE